MAIASAVGPRRPNIKSDVTTVQQLLNRSGSSAALVVDGKYGPRTAAAITNYQSKVMRFGKPDGVVDPRGPTITRLSRQHNGNTTPSRPIPRRAATPPTRTAAPSTGNAPATGGSATPVRTGGAVGPGGLTEATYVDMAARLNCEVAAIKAVVECEVAIRGPFDAQGRPTILFERHKFHKHTGGKYDKSHPDISNPTWGGYGKFSAQYPKLERAMALDHAAGLKSCSWGAFQILGENHVQAGHATVDSFVAAMRKGILPQAEAFVAFVLADSKLLAAIRQRNWATFARIYNGPGYKANDYDGKMRANYQKHAK